VAETACDRPHIGDMTDSPQHDPRYQNGAINRAKRPPESGEKVFLYKIPAPELGPGMYRYVEQLPKGYVEKLPTEEKPLAARPVSYDRSTGEAIGAQRETRTAGRSLSRTR
jgi:hypothetical protein